MGLCHLDQLRLCHSITCAFFKHSQSQNQSIWARPKTWYVRLRLSLPLRRSPFIVFVVLVLVRQARNDRSPRTLRHRQTILLAVLLHFFSQSIT